MKKHEDEEDIQIDPIESIPEEEMTKEERKKLRKQMRKERHRRRE